MNSKKGGLGNWKDMKRSPIYQLQFTFNHQALKRETSAKELLQPNQASFQGQDTPSAPSGNNKAQKTDTELLHLMKEVKNWSSSN